MTTYIQKVKNTQASLNRDLSLVRGADARATLNREISRLDYLLEGLTVSRVSLEVRDAQTGDNYSTSFDIVWSDNCVMDFDFTGGIEPEWFTEHFSFMFIDGGTYQDYTNGNTDEGDHIALYGEVIDDEYEEYYATLKAGAELPEGTRYIFSNIVITEGV